jgi:hypothetical protein
MNKLSVLTPESLQQLVAMLHTHAFLGQNALQVMAYLEILVLALTSHTHQENDKEVAWFRVRAQLVPLCIWVEHVCEAHASVGLRALLLLDLRIFLHESDRD